MDLIVFNVKDILLSDVRDVGVNSNDGSIIIKKDLDFTMSGEIEAGNGRFTIKSEEIIFDYDNFKMFFNEATTLIKIPNNRGEYNAQGELKLDSLANEITITNGELLIDTNINKSGIWKNDYPQYPIIRSYDRSKVFYDQVDILSGVYDRSRFYFDIDPFEIDSLDSYNRSSLSFPGEFNSGNIIPNFRQELRVQQDNSLGFEIHIPKDGYQLYGGKRIFSS